MSRESQRAIKTQREKELRRLYAQIKDTRVYGGNQVWSKSEEDIFEWVELDPPLFVGYIKELVPAPAYQNDPWVQKIARDYTHPVHSKDKRFLKKNKKTRMLESITPRVATVYANDPLRVGIPDVLIPYFEMIGVEYNKTLRRDQWLFSPMMKFFQVKKSKLYYTHVKKLNGQFFRDYDDLEEVFENLGGWWKMNHMLGVNSNGHIKGWRSGEVNYRSEKRDISLV